MADIQQLARNAKTKLDEGNACNEADAIYKAIIGVGIRHKPDVKRLMSEVGTQFARNKHDQVRASQRRV